MRRPTSAAALTLPPDFRPPRNSFSTEEAETSEAIHAAAHPGRAAKAEAEAGADETAEAAVATDETPAAAEEAAS